MCFTAMMVASMVATNFSWPFFSANASAAHTITYPSGRVPSHCDVPHNYAVCPFSGNFLKHPLESTVDFRNRDD